MNKADAIADEVEFIMLSNERLIDEIAEVNQALWGTFGMPFDDLALRNAKEFQSKLNEAFNLMKDGGVL